MTFQVLEIDLSTLKRQLEEFDVSDHFSENDFEVHLDETQYSIEVCGYDYSPGAVFKEIDYVAFREEYNNYLDTIDLEDIEEYREIQERIEELQERVDNWDNILIEDWAGNTLFEGKYTDKEVNQVLKANKFPDKICTLDFESTCENCDDTGYSGYFGVRWQDEDREDNVYEFINY